MEGTGRIASEVETLLLRSRLGDIRIGVLELVGPELTERPCKQTPKSISSSTTPIITRRDTYQVGTHHDKSPRDNNPHIRPRAFRRRLYGQRRGHA